MVYMIFLYYLNAFCIFIIRLNKVFINNLFVCFKFIEPNLKSMKLNNF